ncbi:hypothetical protein GCM10025857_15270 [Alicyclobacillus contaminans]|uniref:phage recombination protein Bet n=1 Tax=Alicyclobacillus contaminans TaxID=392016 RepID=UPI0003F788AB|nr:phage recombination protein Bet [Alicyclobacillus contaminans]GMA50170.1 hypothetical protein GCM10025857_15270 [Alicyclobacillus contaminans]
MAKPEQTLQVLEGQKAVQTGLESFTQEQIEVIKRTVAKGVTDAELSMFLTLCGRYKLDPFLKEIWCIKRQKKDSNGKYVDDPNAPAVIMTSRDGYLKVAQRDPDFDGLKSFVVREGDEFSIDAETDKVSHKFGTKRGKIIGAWAACYHKRRRPAVVFVDFDEYNAGSNTWKQYPSAMIQKVAESMALKRQFGISGLTTQEEMDSTLVVESNDKAAFEAQAEWKRVALELRKKGAAVGFGLTELKKMAHSYFGKADLHDLTIVEMQQMMDTIDKLLADAEAEVGKPQQLDQPAPEREESDDEPVIPGTDISDDDLPF